jgi:hypothetical protein
MTAVEWLVNELKKESLIDLTQTTTIKLILEQAKEMEKEKAHQYAEFAIRCDRLDMRILNFEDWIKL